MADDIQRIIIDLKANDNASQPVHKVAESLALLNKGVAKVIGTFAKINDTVKTSMKYVNKVLTNETANQVKVMQGSFSNFRLAVGDLIVEPATTAITYLNGFFIAMTNLIRAFKPMTAQSGLNDIAENIGGVDDATQGLEKTLGLLSFDKFESLSAKDKGVSGVTGTLEDEPEYMQDFNERMKDMQNAANEIAKSIQSWFINVDVDGKFISWTNNAKGLVAVLAGLAALPIGLKIAAIIIDANRLRDAFYAGAIDEEKLKASLSLVQKIFTLKGLIITGIAASLIYMYASNENFRNSINKLVKELLGLIGQCLQPILDILKIFAPIIGDMLNLVAELISPIIEIAATILQVVNNLGILQPIVWLVLGAFLAWKGIQFIEYLSTISSGIANLAGSILPQIKNAIGSSILSFKMMTNQAKLLSIGIGLVGAAVAFAGLDAWFNSMDEDSRKFAGIATIIVAALTSITVAALAMHGTISMGIAIPVILTAVGAGIAGIKALIPKDVPTFATGGLPTKGQLFIANERGPELVSSIGGQTAVANNDMIVNAIEQAAYRGYLRAIAETKGNNSQPIQVGLEINGREFARATYDDYSAESRRRGKNI